MTMHLIVAGVDPLNSAAVVNRPHVEALQQSGYLADGSDFVGYVARIGGSMTGKLGITRTNVSGFDHALDISFDHLGGPPGGPLSQLGHGINLAVTFTPAATTTRGMQSQKITAKLLGAGVAGGGIDNAQLAALDLSAVLDQTRTGQTVFTVGVNSVASKFNTVDDTPVNGLLTAGMFVVNLHGGKANAVGVLVNINADSLTGVSSAPAFYGMQLSQPVFGAGCSVTTRMAAIYIDDWSATAAAAQGATVPNGYAIYAAGGGIFLANGDFFVNGKSGFNGTAPIAKPTVSGSRATDAWRTSLMSALSSYGLVADTSTA